MYIHIILNLTVARIVVSIRAIFQTFWKQEGCAKFLFFELETSNFGLLAYFLIFFNCANF